MRREGKYSSQQNRAIDLSQPLSQLSHGHCRQLTKAYTAKMFCIIELLLCESSLKATIEENCSLSVVWEFQRRLWIEHAHITSGHMAQLAKGSAINLRLLNRVFLAFIFPFPPHSEPCAVLHLVFHLNHHGKDADYLN